MQDHGVDTSAGLRLPPPSAPRPPPSTGKATWSDAAASDPHGLREYAFLLDRGLAPRTLARAGALAARWGATPHAVLIALGWLSEAAYVRALAQHLGVPVCEVADLTFRSDSFEQTRDVGGLPQALAVDRRRVPSGTAWPSANMAKTQGGVLTVFDATADRPKALARRVGASSSGWGASALTGRSMLETALQLQKQRQMLKRATWGLHRLAPGYSAASPITARQAVRTGT